MKNKRCSTTASFGFYYCDDCKWPAVFACCNGSFTDYKDAGDWDWWLYCSNKGCENHDGEGIFQKIPDWARNESSENV